MGIWAEKMITRLESQAEWPAADDKRVWNQVKTWIAFMENDRNMLRTEARWRNQVREYLVDPLAPKISEAFASVIFGSAPTFTAASSDDKQQLADLITGNNLPRRLQREHKRVSSEAETWWRITSNPDLYDYPQVTFHSRLGVIPSFSGNDQLRAVTFIDVLYAIQDDSEETVWRHFEIIDGDSINNVLFLGTHDTVGTQVSLDRHPETADLAEKVFHDLPRMPAGRVVNREGLDVFYGISDYAGIEDFLYGLNEILTIFHENVRLTLKKRVAVPASAVDESGTIDASQEVFVKEPLDRQIGANAGKGDASGQFEVLEYTSDIEEVIKAQNAAAENALTRVGITPAYIGMTTDQSQGRAITGTALRLRLIPTTNAGEDRAAYWDDEGPQFLVLAQILDARPPAEPGSGTLGGYGRQWASPAQPPGMDRGSNLPQDPVEETEVHGTRVSSGIESRYTAIKALHPDWEDALIAQEITRINEDIAAKAPVGGLMDSGHDPAKIPGG